MSGSLRIAVVGCGYWGPKHVRVLSGLPEVAELSVVDRSAERVRSLTRAFPSARGYASLEAALPYCDAVVIAAPPRSHLPLALQALEAGKHVLVEKPLATTTAEAVQLVRTAEQAGMVLMVGHTFEYNPALRKMRELIRGGDLGDLFYIDTARLNLGLYQNDVNVIFDLAPHDISILNFLLGGPPTSVQAWASRHAHSHLEDVAYLRLKYAQFGISANVHVSWLDPCKVRRVTAVGSGKMAVYNDLLADEPIRVYDKGVIRTDVGSDVTLAPMSYRYGDITSPYVRAQEPLAVQDEHFVDAIRSGSPVRTDGRNGLSVVQVLECAQRSVTSGRVVYLKEVDSGLPEPAPVARSRTLWLEPPSIDLAFPPAHAV